MDKSTSALQQNNNVQTQRAHSLGPGPPLNGGQPQKVHPKPKPEQSKAGRPKKRCIQLNAFLIFLLLQRKKEKKRALL